MGFLGMKKTSSRRSEEINTRDGKYISDDSYDHSSQQPGSEGRDDVNVKSSSRPGSPLKSSKSERKSLDRKSSERASGRSSTSPGGKDGMKLESQRPTGGSGRRPKSPSGGTGGVGRPPSGRRERGVSEERAMRRSEGSKGHQKRDSPPADSPSEDKENHQAPEIDHKVQEMMKEMEQDANDAKPTVKKEKKKSSSAAAPSAAAAAVAVAATANSVAGSSKVSKNSADPSTLKNVRNSKKPTPASNARSESRNSNPGSNNTVKTSVNSRSRTSHNSSSRKPRTQRRSRSRTRSGGREGKSSRSGRRGRIADTFSDDECSVEVELSESEEESVDSHSSSSGDEDTSGSGSYTEGDTSGEEGEDGEDGESRAKDAHGSFTDGTSATDSYEDSFRKDKKNIADNAFERRGAVDPTHQAIVQVNEYGSVEKLLLQELCHTPQAVKPDDVVIKVECSTISLQDCMIRRGKWYEMQKLPFVPGSDIVGTVHELGYTAIREGGFSVGDRVAAVVPSGGNAKYITLSYESIFKVPPEIDPVVALCLSSTYVPAREALDLARKLNTPFTGANILVIGGNGPSGLATIELAMLEGANVFTTSDERHHEYLANLGAKCFPIDPAKWLPQLRGKMDVVLDSVCLDGYESSMTALNKEGTLVCTGLSAVYTQGQIRAYGLKDVRDIKALYVKMRAKFFLNNTVYYDRLVRYEEAPNEYAQHFRYLCHIASKDIIKPVVSARASLNMVAFMHKAIEHGNTPYGVCVCTPWITRSDM